MATRVWIKNQNCAARGNSAGRDRDPDQHGDRCAAGLIAGYRRGVTDEVIMRTLDVMLAFPPIMLVLLIVAVTRPSVMKTAIAIGSSTLGLDAAVRQGPTATGYMSREAARS